MTTITEGRQVSHGLSWKAYGRHRYAFLFYCLLMLMIATPIAAALGFPQVVIRLLAGLVLIAAIMPSQTYRNRYILLATMVMVVAVRMVSEREEVPISASSMTGLMGVIGLLGAATALRTVVKANRVDAEVIYAALSTYLLAGIFFAQLHLAVEGYAPGSYAGPSDFTEATATYFSFVTLATLGYGDFLPKTDLARGLTIFEVIGGQLYLAVMVARLIGMFPGSREQS